MLVEDEKIKEFIDNVVNQMKKNPPNQAEISDYLEEVYRLFDVISTLNGNGAYSIVGSAIMGFQTVLQKIPSEMMPSAITNSVKDQLVLVAGALSTISENLTKIENYDRNVFKACSEMFLATENLYKLSKKILSSLPPIPGEQSQ